MKAMEKVKVTTLDALTPLIGKKVIVENKNAQKIFEVEKV